MPIIKFIGLLLMSLFLLSFSSDQTNRKEAEKELDKLKGSLYIKKGIELGASYQNRENYNDALYFYKKALKKSNEANSKSAEAVVAYEIATNISLRKYDLSLANFAVEVLTIATDNLIDKKYVYNIYVLAIYFTNQEPTGNKSDLKRIINKTQGVYNAAEKEKEEAALEASTVRVNKEELSSINEKVTSLSSLKDILSEKMKANEILVGNMTRDNLVKEMLLEKQNRFIDSLGFKSVIDSISLENKNYQIAKGETEISLQRANNNLLLSLAGLVLLMSGFLFYRFSLAKAHNKTLSEKNKIIEIERQRSEELLLNILPLKVAEELKENGKVMAQYYDTSTIMFTDFVNFSKITKSQTPQQLVTDLDYCFGRFDTIVHQYKLEKIKTIGDAYMCISGVPDKNVNHAENAVHVAMEFLDFLKVWNKERTKAGNIPFHIRIGLHSGPVAAGVVGKSKFVFDVWGDAVNIASRMEANAEDDKINISESTYEMVKDKYLCEERGAVKMKNMKEMNMFFVKSKI